MFPFFTCMHVLKFSVQSQILCLYDELMVVISGLYGHPELHRRPKDPGQVGRVHRNQVGNGIGLLLLQLFICLSGATRTRPTTSATSSTRRSPGAPATRWTRRTPSAATSPGALATRPPPATGAHRATSRVGSPASR